MFLTHHQNLKADFSQTFIKWSVTAEQMVTYWRQKLCYVLEMSAVGERMFCLCLLRYVLATVF